VRGGPILIAIGSETPGTEEVSMDYIVEAKKFIERARDASHPEVISQDLSMAEWCLSQALAERCKRRPKPEEPKKLH
jgi:hypothetical protein